MRAVREAETKLHVIKGCLSTACEKFEKHVKGFLDANQCREVLERDLGEMRMLEERCMKLLETLDGIMGEGCVWWRKERKIVVGAVNECLREIDGLRDRIDVAKKDVWGVVEKARGKG